MTKQAAKEETILHLAEIGPHFGLGPTWKKILGMRYIHTEETTFLKNNLEIFLRAALHHELVPQQIYELNSSLTLLNCHLK